MQRDKWEFWSEITEKINTHNDYTLLAPEVLEDICNFFDFGCGVFYQSNNGKHFALDGAFYKYQGYEMPYSLTLDQDILNHLRGKISISFRANTPKGPLEEKLSQLFGMGSLVLVPVGDPDGQLMALLGIGDRRGTTRYMQEDMAMTRSVLIKLSALVGQRIRTRRVEVINNALESIVDNMGVDIYVADLETCEIVYANASMAEPYGGVDALIGRPCWQALHKDRNGPCECCPMEKLLDEKGKPKKAYAWNYNRPTDGAWFRVNNVVIPWMNGRLVQVVSSVDITENYKREEMIRKMAEYDTLTGIPNRAKMAADSDLLLAQKNDNRNCYATFIDLDGFKEVNDTLGHLTGDALLTAIGRAFQENPLTTNGAYRYGGDEFVLLWDEKERGSCEKMVACLRDIFSRRWNIEGNIISLRASIGVSRYPADAATTADLIRRADQAMYQSKLRKQGEIFFYNQGNYCPAEAYLGQNEG